MLASGLVLVAAAIFLATDVRVSASTPNSTFDASSSTRPHVHKPMTTIVHSSLGSTSNHSAPSPTLAPGSSSTGNPETGTIVTITTVLVTSLYPIPTDGPMPSAPYTPPLPGSRDFTRTPTVRGVGSWTSPVQRARAVVAGLTLEERVNLTTGTGWGLGHCVGNIGPIDRIGFPGLCLEDSPLGVREADHVTAFPAGINAAATWDRGYLRHRGRAMGAEFRGKGANIQLGPMMNMGRDAAGGRNWEGFGADPYLAGEAAYETVVGIQSQGVQACAKHYIGNEQEHNRTTSSSNIDDKTLHEVYLHPFLRAVAADIASIMCSYNLINGTWSCENVNSLSNILKGELGFQGFVMSDWGATHSTLDAEAGLDMTMPGDIVLGYGNSYFGPNLTDYVNNGTISDIRLNDMATRILAAYYLTKQDDEFPVTNFDAFLRNSSFNQHVVVTDSDHQQIAYDIAVASTILLKNVDNALPLKKPKTLAMIGSDCEPPPYGPNFYSDRGGDSGTLAMGWGSGTCDFPYLISPLEAIQGRGRKDLTSVSWFTDDWDLDNAGYAAAYKDVAIVFVNSDSGEGYIIVDGNEGDRNNLTAWNNGDALIQTVAGNNSNTVVVIHSVGPLILEPWIEHPNITAVVWAGLPGQESGSALRDILYGDANPSGRLPYTIAKNASDYSGGIVTDSDPLSIKQVPYTERLLIDYRHFDTYGIEPRYEFGFGLSYTNFKYSNLIINRTTYGDEGYLEAAWAKGNVEKHSIGSSLDTWLHRPVWNVTFDVTNAGSMAGAEVSQLYLEFPQSAENPPSVLRGFERTFLRIGQTSKVIMMLSRYDLSVWNSVQQGWSRPSGSIGVHIGASSRDFRLSGAIA